MLKISLITVVYNSRDTIADTLKSVAEQDYQNIEYIVIDGGSTDGTLETINGFRERIDMLVSEPDDGPTAAQNKGIQMATGEVIGFLHADDIFADKNVVTKVAKAFASKPRAVAAVYGDLEYVSARDVSRILRYWRAEEFSPARLKRGWMPPNPTLFVRKEHYDNLGGICTRYKIACDYHLSLRLFSQPDFYSTYIPEVLVKMRWGGRSNSLKNIIRKSYEDFRALRETGVGGLGTLAWKNISKLEQFFIRR